MTDKIQHGCRCSDCDHRRTRAPSLADARRYLRDRREYYTELSNGDWPAWGPPPSHPGTFGEWLHERDIGTAPPTVQASMPAWTTGRTPAELHAADVDRRERSRPLWLPTRYKPEPRIIVSPNGKVVRVYEPEDP